MYRPFSKRHLLFYPQILERTYQFTRIFPTPETEAENCVICVPGLGGRANWSTFITDVIPNLALTSLDSFQCFPFYTYDEDGNNRKENITDWALSQFREEYEDESISKWDVFYYVYGMLHHPAYREKFADNLKRELPRIPFAADFWAVSKIGSALADLHLNYETGERYKLEWVTKKDTPVDFRVEKMRKRGNSIEYNHTLTLKGIPAEAWEYKLGNRSALDWLIDQYRVKTHKRSGIVSDPNTYSDDPRYIVELIERVTHLSVETMKLVNQLESITW
ncbi:MAG: hypothetical protein CUN56_01985 [Phototrophicales bacterium]|nr:MAG: hypothetical protein CUN56_01985 [Phototrophicales bacterium]